jgi:hypothetical protein
MNGMLCDREWALAQTKVATSSHKLEGRGDARDLARQAEKWKDDASFNAM